MLPRAFQYGLYCTKSCPTPAEPAEPRTNSPPAGRAARHSAPQGSCSTGVTPSPGFSWNSTCAADKPFDPLLTADPPRRTMSHRAGRPAVSFLSLSFFSGCLRSLTSMSVPHQKTGRPVQPPACSRTLHHPSFMPLYSAAGFERHLRNSHTGERLFNPRTCLVQLRSLTLTSCLSSPSHHPSRLLLQRPHRGRREEDPQHGD